jgi:protein involved in polysaccharide export with SLBB domain
MLKKAYVGIYLLGMLANPLCWAADYGLPQSTMLPSMMPPSQVVDQVPAQAVQGLPAGQGLQFLPGALPSGYAPQGAVGSVPKSRMFGAQLFNGSFRNLYSSGFNPNYQINVGDRIKLRMWGAFNFDGLMDVDPQGNIFLPNIGPVSVAGLKNSELNAIVEKETRRLFKANVSVYATLDVSQPVKVFVTGYIMQPGIYAGVAAESPISYLDRAGGVDPERGSYVDITVKRGNEVRKKINLYDFLLNGQLDFIQLQDGDAIVVGSRKHSFSVMGEAFNPYDFEFEQSEISMEKALSMAKPKPGATHVSLVRRQGESRSTEYYALDKVAGIKVQDGDIVTLTSDRYAGTIQVRVEGAHNSAHAVVLPYGATMKDVLAQVRPNAKSNMGSIQLFRKSTAERQKEMLKVGLEKLEESFLSARSKTEEEAKLRTAEAALINKFVAIAKTVEPKGQVVLDNATLPTTLLEDGDIINIPERTSLVQVYGEVIFPNAVSWRDGFKPDDYIKQVGGYTQGADTSKVIIIRQNGEALEAQNARAIMAGDEIMVLPKIESKSIEVVRAITQIIFQLAVSAKVLFTSW